MFRMFHWQICGHMVYVMTLFSLSSLGCFLDIVHFTCVTEQLSALCCIWLQLITQSSELNQFSKCNIHHFLFPL